MPSQIAVGVTMQIQSAPTISISSGAVSPNESTRKQDQGQILLKSNSVRSTAQLGLLSDNVDARARAAGKIEDAKEQLEFLKRYGFPPDVIARLAGELARSVGAAAQEFYQAAGTSGSTSAPSAAAITDGAAALAQPATSATEDTEQNTAKDASKTNDGKADDTDSVDVKQAMLAYGATVNDGGKSQNFSAEDQRIIDQFNALKAEIKALLDKARRDMQAEKQPGSQPVSAAPDVDVMGEQPVVSPAPSAVFI